jgi:hypothetical protein
MGVANEPGWIDEHLPAVVANACAHRDMLAVHNINGVRCVEETAAQCRATVYSESAKASVTLQPILPWIELHHRRHLDEPAPLEDGPADLPIRVAVPVVVVWGGAGDTCRHMLINGVDQYT